MKNNWAFRAQTSGSVLCIEIYDVIDPSAYSDPFWGSYGVSAAQILETLKAAPSATEIKVRINSAGGDVFDGMAIYNLLNAHSARVCVYIDGLCASIASIIAMAGDEIVMGEGTWMMVHMPYSAYMAESDAEDLRKTADVLDQMAEGLCAIYVARTGQSQAQIKKLMAEETWLTAAEAKELGFCTQVTPAKSPEQPQVDDSESRALNAALLKKFARMPAGAFMAMARAHKELKMSIQASAARPLNANASTKDDYDDKEDKLAKELEASKKELDEAKKAKKEAEDALKEYKEKAKAKKAKSGMDDDDDDDDDDDKSSAGSDSKKAEARALAKLGLTARALTGAGSLVEAEAALVALAARNDKLVKLDSEMEVMRKERHVARVSTLIAEGKLMPSRKEWAISASAADIDAYLNATGGEAIVPLSQEFRQPAAKTAARPSKGIITAEDRAIAKHTGLTEDQLQQAADLRMAKFGV